MFSREIVAVAPETVGMHRDRLDRAVDVLRSGVGTAFPGATLCAFRKNRCFLDLAFGTHGGSSPVRLESLYDLASLTKPMATASSILTLVERGKLSYTDTLGILFGDADAGAWKGVTVKQLVTHVSGLPAWLPLYKSGPGLDSAVKTILATPAEDRPKPGANYEYSCLNYILLGRVVEMVSDKSLAAFARENIFAPLGMIDTMFQPDALMHKRIAPTRSDEGPEETLPVTLCGSVHDGNARGIGGTSGNAGLFGTARDVARFGNALLHPGETRLFGDPTLTRVWENQIPGGVGGQSLLFYTDCNGYNPSGDLLSPRTVGHSGYTGTILTIDPANDLVVSVLTNSVYPLENGVGKPGWLALRRRFLNALAAAITG